MSKSIGTVCLAIYLLLVGLISLFGINLDAVAIVVPIFAIVAAIALFSGR